MGMAGWSGSTTGRSARRSCPSRFATRSRRRLGEVDAADDRVPVLAVRVRQVAAELPAGLLLASEDVPRLLFEAAVGVRPDPAHVEDLVVLVPRDLLLHGPRAPALVVVVVEDAEVVRLLRLRLPEGEHAELVRPVVLPGRLEVQRGRRRGCGRQGTHEHCRDYEI